MIHRLTCNVPCVYGGESETTHADQRHGVEPAFVGINNLSFFQCLVRATLSPPCSCYLVASSIPACPKTHRHHHEIITYETTLSFKSRNHPWSNDAFALGMPCSLLDTTSKLTFQQTLPYLFRMHIPVNSPTQPAGRTQRMAAQLATTSLMPIKEAAIPSHYQQ